MEQIKKADFGRDSDVKRLYEKASTIENQITNITYDGNAAPIKHLLDVTDKLKKAPEVRIIQISPFRAFSSGVDTIENVLGAFQQWQEEHNHLVRKMMYGASDFLWFEGDCIWSCESEMHRNA